MLDQELQTFFHTMPNKNNKKKHGDMLYQINTRMSFIFKHVYIIYI